MGVVERSVNSDSDSAIQRRLRCVTEPVMPDSGCPNEIGVLSERSQSEFRFLIRDEAATPGD